MRVNLEIQPGQETRGDKLTISEVLAEYLRAEKGRLDYFPAQNYEPASPTG